MCRRRVSGSPAATRVDEVSLDTWNSPTAPLKSLGRPSLGSDRTFSAEEGLAIVTSFGATPLYGICENGQPNWAANAWSSSGRVLSFTLIGVSTDREKSPGFTAASALCQVMTRKGLPAMIWLRRRGCFERLLSVKSLPVSAGGPFSDVTIPGRM